MSDYLQQAAVPLINRNLCSCPLTNRRFHLNRDQLIAVYDKNDKQRWQRLKDYEGGFNIASTQLCAGSSGHGTAQGDSGGPLVVRNSDGIWFQIGITSFGINVGPLYYDQGTAP
ncbi:hypothetical protein ANCCAN_14152, partial [Ancylostoma caninum]